MVTLLAWMAHKLVSSKSPTRYASLASCRATQPNSGTSSQFWNPGQSLAQVSGRAISLLRVGTLLITTNLSQGYGSGPVSVRFFYPSGSRSRLTCCFGRKLLSRCFSTRWFSCSLFCPGHVNSSTLFNRISVARLDGEDYSFLTPMLFWTDLCYASIFSQVSRKSWLVKTSRIVSYLNKGSVK